MRPVRLLLAVLLAALFAACGDDGDDGNELPRVMTRNLYLGADIGPLVLLVPPVLGGGDPTALLQQVTQTYLTVQASDPAARMRLVAEEIAATRPHLVGLQEVTLWRTQTPADNLPGATVPPTSATQVEFDFLQLLLEDLAARGQSYRVVSEVQNFDAELPAALPGRTSPLTDVRLTDRDVILARADVATSDEASENYFFRVPLGTGANALAIPRGWTAVTATVGDRTFRFMNTHLEVSEPAQLGQIQQAQAGELLQIAAQVAGPLILVGDFNSPADRSGTTSYGSIVDAGGFTDAWSQLNPSDPGLTCCWPGTADPATNLKPVPAPFDERIDIVFLRGGMRPFTVDLVGEDPNVLTPAPSSVVATDHAGVVATVDGG